MRILIIEDDKFFQHFYSTKLQESGYVTEVADDGEAGLLKIQSFQPDLILLDLIMPKKDGFEVLESMKANPPPKKIPVIVFTTLEQQSDLEKVKSLGASDRINKDFAEIEILKTKIAKYLNSTT